MITVAMEKRVTEHGYNGGSLDRGGLAIDPLLLAPNDLSGSNSLVATVVENAPMIGNGFRCGGEASSTIERKVSADTLALRRSSQ